LASWSRLPSLPTGALAEAFLFDATEYRQYTTSLHKRFATFVVGLLFLLVALALAEHWGLPKAWVAGIFLSVTLVLYAVIGVFAAHCGCE